MGSALTIIGFDDFNSQLVPDEFPRRIVVLGKTGAGKSSLANTVFGECVFATDSSPESGTSECQAESRCVNGKNIIFIDTPGFFDTGRPVEEMKPAIMRCITECAPGPHVFLIVLKVDKFTEQEKDVIRKMNDYFSEEALKYTTVLFTHGDQLPKETKIEEFVSQSKDLSDLVKKCGGRCNVIDNKYWANNQEEKYRNNKFQVKKLLSTIDEIIEANKEGYYSNEILQAVKREINQEHECIKESSSNLSEDEVTQKAKTAVIGKLLHIASGERTGALLKAFLSVPMSGAVRVEYPTLTLGLALAAAVARVVTAENTKVEAPTTSVAAPHAELLAEEQE